MKSIMQDTKECYLCRLEADRIGWSGEIYSRQLHRHHVMYGTADRKKSEQYGLWVWLCVERHHVYGPDAVHQNREVRDYLCCKAQEAFETKFGHDRWMQEFGKDWIAAGKEKL